VLFVLTVLEGNSALSGHQKVSEKYFPLFRNVSLVIARLVSVIILWVLCCLQ